MTELGVDKAAALRRISPAEFARRLRHAVAKHDARLVWMLGAGCSVSSGVGDAAAVARRWLSELKYLETGDESDVEDWALSRFPQYDPTAPEGVYQDVLDALFYTEQDRQRELERLTAAAEPGFGYATLAQLVAHAEWGERCNTILTTNFDDLAADALYLYSRRKPQVLTHESFDRRARISAFRPTIIKIHGDAHLPRSEEDNRPLLDRDVKDRLRAQLTESMLVILGYGGRDACVLDLLEGLPRGAPAGGVFWVNADLPPPPTLAWLASRDAVWAPSEDFDALMHLLRQEFALGYPQIDRFDQILRRYDEEAARLAQQTPLGIDDPDDGSEGGGGQPRLRAPRRPARPEEPGLESGLEAAPEPEPETAPDVASSAPPRPFEDLEQIRQSIAATYAAKPAAEAEPDAEAASEAGSEAGPPRRRSPVSSKVHAMIAAAAERPRAEGEAASANGEALRAGLPRPGRLLDRETAIEGDRLYRAAMRETPSDAPLIAQYADFLAVGRRDYDGAEHYFNRAFDVDPGDDLVLRLYAGFLIRVRKDYDRAEDCFRLAVKADRISAETLCDYGDFLADQRGDLDAAEECFKLAVDCAPRAPDPLRRYARFLSERRANFDAACTLFKAASRIGESASAFADLGDFLARRRADREAAGKIFAAAAQIAPRNASILLRRAAFLAADPAEPEQAEPLYEAVLALAPHCAAAHAAYAGYLAERGREDDAEERFVAALRADPGDPRPLIAYARFLERRRGEFDDADTMYRRAVSVAPKSAAAQAAYAAFLSERLGRYESAEERFVRAVSIAPFHAGALTAYGRFLRGRGRFGEAEGMLRRAVAAAPASPAALVACAEFLHEALARDEEAEPFYRRAIDAAPAEADAPAFYGRFVRAAHKDETAAEALFERALAIAPDHPTALAGMAQSLLTAGKAERGEAMLDWAFEALRETAPEHAPAGLMIELWTLRYAFMADQREAAMKAVLSLARAGAAASAAALDPVVEQTDAEDAPDRAELTAVIDVAVGRTPPEGLDPLVA